MREKEKQAKKFFHLKYKINIYYMYSIVRNERKNGKIYKKLWTDYKGQNENFGNMEEKSLMGK
jgi:hypothetical protein